MEDIDDDALMLESLLEGADDVIDAPGPAEDGVGEDALQDGEAGEEGEQAEDDDDVDEADVSDEGGDADVEQQDAAGQVLEEEEVTSEEEEVMEQEEDRKQRMAEALEAMRNAAIMNSFSAVEYERYEAYTRSVFDKAKMRKYIAQVAGHVPHDSVVTLTRGVAKVYVGELVETARMIATEWGHKGPLLPAHIHAAHRLLEGKQRVKQGKRRRQLA